MAGENEVEIQCSNCGDVHPVVLANVLGATAAAFPAIAVDMVIDSKTRLKNAIDPNKKVTDDMTMIEAIDKRLNDNIDKAGLYEHNDDFYCEDCYEDAVE